MFFRLAAARTFSARSDGLVSSYIPGFEADQPFGEIRVAVAEIVGGAGCQGAVARIQGGDGQHVFRAQGKIQHRQIFFHAFGAHGFHQGNDIALPEPAQGDLAHCFAVFFTYFCQQGVVEEIVFALGKGTPGFGDNAVGPHMIDRPLAPAGGTRSPRSD